jgi:pyridoxal/pyridoxine/pyridoxamine kinase
MFGVIAAAGLGILISVMTEHPTTRSAIPLMTTREIHGIKLVTLHTVQMATHITKSAIPLTIIAAKAGTKLGTPPMAMTGARSTALGTLIFSIQPQVNTDDKWE